MKKLLVVGLAMSSLSAFAQKSLITFGSFGDGGNSETFDVSNSTRDDDVTTTTSLEFGHRFAAGSWKGFNLAFSPSISYAISTKEFDASGTKDLETTALAWNCIKFDVLF
jgi:hypothetical protein